jgi:hypothetical protein
MSRRPSARPSASARPSPSPSPSPSGSDMTIISELINTLFSEAEAAAKAEAEAEKEQNIYINIDNIPGEIEKKKVTIRKFVKLIPPLKTFINGINSTNKTFKIYKKVQTWKTLLTTFLYPNIIKELNYLINIIHNDENPNNKQYLEELLEYIALIEKDQETFNELYDSKFNKKPENLLDFDFSDTELDKLYTDYKTHAKENDTKIKVYLGELGENRKIYGYIEEIDKIQQQLFEFVSKFKKKITQQNKQELLPIIEAIFVNKTYSIMENIDRIEKHRVFYREKYIHKTALEITKLRIKIIQNTLKIEELNDIIKLITPDIKQNPDREELTRYNNALHKTRTEKTVTKSQLTKLEPAEKEYKEIESIYDFLIKGYHLYYEKLIQYRTVYMNNYRLFVWNKEIPFDKLNKIVTLPPPTQRLSPRSARSASARGGNTNQHKEDIKHLRKLLKNKKLTEKQKEQYLKKIESIKVKIEKQNKTDKINKCKEHIKNLQKTLKNKNITESQKQQCQHKISNYKLKMEELK